MKRITLEQRQAEIAERIAAGVRLPPAAALRRPPDAPRTPSKRALLEAVRAAAAAQGRKPPFDPD